MTTLKPFNETMTEIANVFGFKDIQLDELEKYYKLELQDVDTFNKKRMNVVLFLRNYSDETLIMLEFVKLYIRFIRVVDDYVNVGFIVKQIGPSSTVYSSLEKLTEYFVRCYEFCEKDTYTLIQHFKAVQLVKII